MRTIHEVGPGDYVKVGRRYKKIKRVVKRPDPDSPEKLKSWTVITDDGKRISMYAVTSFHKKEEMWRERGR